jgi:hypothetical protein
MYENPGSHPLEARTFGYKISYSPDIAKKAKAREIKKRKELRMFYIELIKYLNYKGVNREKDLKSQMKHLYQSYGIDFLNESEILTLIRKNPFLESFVKNEMKNIVNKRGD